MEAVVIAYKFDIYSLRKLITWKKQHVLSENLLHHRREVFQNKIPQYLCSPNKKEIEISFRE